MQTLALARASSTKLLVQRPLLLTLWGALVLGSTWTRGFLFGVGVALLAGAVALIAVRCRAVRAWLVRAEERAEWRRRCARREKRLVEAQLSTLGLEEATSLVLEAEACNPVASSCLELEKLLDRYVEISVRVGLGERALLSTQRFGVRESPLRHDLEQRQWEARAQLRSQIGALRDDLESIAELLCLVVQRGALETITLAGDPIDERLALYAEVSESFDAMTSPECAVAAAGDASACR